MSESNYEPTTFDSVPPANSRIYGLAVSKRTVVGFCKLIGICEWLIMLFTVVLQPLDRSQEITISGWRRIVNNNPRVYRSIFSFLVGYVCVLYKNIDSFLTFFCCFSFSFPPLIPRSTFIYLYICKNILTIACKKIMIVPCVGNHPDSIL